MVQFKLQLEVRSQWAADMLLLLVKEGQPRACTPAGESLGLVGVSEFPFKALDSHHYTCTKLNQSLQIQSPCNKNVRYKKLRHQGKRTRATCDCQGCHPSSQRSRHYGVHEDSKLYFTKWSGGGARTTRSGVARACPEKNGGDQDARLSGVAHRMRLMGVSKVSGPQELEAPVYGQLGSAKAGMGGNLPACVKVAVA